MGEFGRLVLVLNDIWCLKITTAVPESLVLGTDSRKKGPVEQKPSARVRVTACFYEGRYKLQSGVILLVFQI